VVGIKRIGLEYSLCFEELICIIDAGEIRLRIDSSSEYSLTFKGLFLSLLIRVIYALPTDSSPAPPPSTGLTRPAASPEPSPPASNTAGSSFMPPQRKQNSIPWRPSPRQFSRPKIHRALVRQTFETGKIAAPANPDAQSDGLAEPHGQCRADLPAARDRSPSPS
jgi:hypothetical protein